MGGGTNSSKETLFENEVNYIINDEVLNFDASTSVDEIIEEEPILM